MYYIYVWKALQTKFERNQIGQNYDGEAWKVNHPHKKNSIMMSPSRLI